MAELSLAHHRAGSGDPLVLVHGIGSCRRCWDPVVPLLQEHHEVFAIDLPGYGDSPPLDDEPTAYALTDAVEQALSAAGLERPHLVGNSLGGWIVAELAARGSARSAVGLSPAGLSTRREAAWLRGTLSYSYKSAVRIAPMAERLTATAAGRALLFGQMHTRPWRVSPESAAWQLRRFAGCTGFPELLVWLTTQGNVPRVAGIECPFRVAWGTRDLVLPFRQAARWQRYVGAEVVPLPGLGHLPMPDDPELVAASILEVTAARPSVLRRPAAAPA